MAVVVKEDATYETSPKRPYEKIPNEPSSNIKRPIEKSTIEKNLSELSPNKNRLSVTSLNEKQA